jgi:hypothetical protein
MGDESRLSRTMQNFPLEARVRLRGTDEPGTVKGWAVGRGGWDEDVPSLVVEIIRQKQGKSYQGVYMEIHPTSDCRKE